MNSFLECRSCYNHIGGKLAVKYFSYLLNNNYIAYDNDSTFKNMRQRIPLIITPRGIDYFKFLTFPIKSYGFAFACLDGTEKKPHLSGKVGDLFYKFLSKENFINPIEKSRILEYNINAKNIMLGVK